MLELLSVLCAFNLPINDTAIHKQADSGVHTYRQNVDENKKECITNTYLGAYHLALVLSQLSLHPLLPAVSDDSKSVVSGMI